MIIYNNYVLKLHSPNDNKLFTEIRSNIIAKTHKDLFILHNTPPYNKMSIKFINTISLICYNNCFYVINTNKTTSGELQP